MTDDRFRKPAAPARRLAELRGGAAGTGEVASADAMPEAEEIAEEAFSTISADRHQKVMLELRFKTGDAKALAYTTFLTVMRNLAKRRLLDQRKTATKRHQFVVLVDEESYKSGVVRQIFKDYCDNDTDRLLRFLGVQNKLAG